MILRQTVGMICLYMLLGLLLVGLCVATVALWRIDWHGGLFFGVTLVLIAGVVLGGPYD